MGDTVGGPIYIGGDKAADEFVQDHAVQWTERRSLNPPCWRAQ